MPNAERVSFEDVRRVAELAHLELEPDEESRMRRDLNAILDYVAQLGELDTAQVEPMAQVSEVLKAGSGEKLPEKLPFEESRLRADTVRPSLDREVVMAQAPETDGVFFKVPKVIEKVNP
jgi:aspartyl-tRNA(Asn)/glutamyl-tRNA(Gln) amidotransferase subunit C